MRTIHAWGNFTDPDRVRTLLPDNYWIFGKTADGKFIVHGRDVAGWNAEDYVIPRLQSGLIAAEVIR